MQLGRRQIIGALNLARLRVTLPLQVAAICYRLCSNGDGDNIEFLLVQTSGSRRKWTFPKGAPSQRLSNPEAAAREAREEAGAFGRIERRHFHHYVHSKAVAGEPEGTQEFVVRAFLLEVRRVKAPQEFRRNPTWFSAAEARRALSQGRQAKYRDELVSVVDRAMDRLQMLRRGSAAAK